MHSNSDTTSADGRTFTVADMPAAKISLESKTLESKVSLFPYFECTFGWSTSIRKRYLLVHIDAWWFLNERIVTRHKQRLVELYSVYFASVLPYFPFTKEFSVVCLSSVSSRLLPALIKVSLTTTIILYSLRLLDMSIVRLPSQYKHSNFSMLLELLALSSTVVTMWSPSTWSALFHFRDGKPTNWMFIFLIGGIAFVCICLLVIIGYLVVKIIRINCVHQLDDQRIPTARNRHVTLGLTERSSSLTKGVNSRHVHRQRRRLSKNRRRDFSRNETIDSEPLEELTEQALLDQTPNSPKKLIQLGFGKLDANTMLHMDLSEPSVSDLSIMILPNSPKTNSKKDAVKKRLSKPFKLSKKGH